MKLAIDRYIAGRRSRRPRTASRCCTSLILVGAFVLEFAQTWTAADDRAADHVRPAHGRSTAPAAPRPALLRPQPGRPADDPRDDRRRRAQRSLHVGRRLDLRRRLHARRHHGRDAVDELAAGAGRLRRAAADRRSSRSGSAATSASRTATVRGWIARINAFLQEHITGHVDGAAVPARSARTTSGSTRSTRKHRDANVDSIFYYAVFYPAIESSARWRRR